MTATVGDNIEVYWPLDKEYYPATITAVHPTSRMYTLSYFDGEVEDIHLLKETWRFLENNNPSVKSSLPSAPKKIVHVGNTQKKNHPEPILPASTEICTITITNAPREEDARKPWESIAPILTEKIVKKPPSSGMEQKLTVQPKRRRRRIPISESRAVISKPSSSPSSQRRASLRQKGSRPEFLKGLSEHSITKRRKRALSNSSSDKYKSEGSSSSSSILDNDYEDLRPALLLIARSSASWLRLDMKSVSSPHKRCLQYSLNMLTSAAANENYLKNLEKKNNHLQDVSIYFQPQYEAQNFPTEQNMKEMKRPGNVGKETEILKTVSKIVLRAGAGVKPKKGEKAIVTAISLVLRALVDIPK